MQWKHWARAFGVPCVLVMLGTVGCGPDVKVVDVIPRMYSNESHPDMEPNLAVNNTRLWLAPSLGACWFPWS